MSYNKKENIMVLNNQKNLIIKEEENDYALLFIILLMNLNIFHSMIIEQKIQ